MALEFPANPADGDVYPAAPNSEYIYNDAKGAWLSLPTEAAKTITSDIAPVNAKDGDQWFNSIDGCLYLYYVDVDGGQWLQTKNDASFTSTLGPRVDAMEAGDNRNVILNGAFEINQRGLTTSGNSGYGFDRWSTYFNGGSGNSVSAQAFTAGSGSIPGQEPKSFMRHVTSGLSGVNDQVVVYQPIENVRTFAGQTVTVSFWAKAGSGTPNLGIVFARNYGTGGSPSATEYGVVGSTIVLTGGTTWNRYAVTLSVPSLAGKTLGTTDNTSSINLQFIFAAGSTAAAAYGGVTVGIQNNTFDIWGVQVQQGALATAFHRNAPSLQAELAACQRYYYRMGGEVIYSKAGSGFAYNTTSAVALNRHPVTMRIPPTSIEVSSTSDWVASGVTTYNLSALAMVANQSNRDFITFVCTSSGMTANSVIFLESKNITSAYIGVSAEL